jgi:glycine cleavage system H protein
MSDIREELKYTKTDEWIRVEGDTATIGITDYAQSHLGDIVFVELKQNGVKFNKGDILTTIESVKSASDIYTPISGELIDMNKNLESDSGIINKEPYDGGWIAKIKISDHSDINGLLDSNGYKDLHKE